MMEIFEIQKTLMQLRGRRNKVMHSKKERNLSLHLNPMMRRETKAVKERKRTMKRMRMEKKKTMTNKMRF
jgi:hypothetical protein